MNLQSTQGKISLAAGFVALFVFYKIATESPAIDWLRVSVEQAGPWAPVAYVALRASTYIIAPISLPGIELTGGILFGLWQGTALSIVGQTFGGSVNYWIARLLGRPGVERFAGKKSLLRVDEFYERVRGWQGLLAARLVLPGYDFLSYVAGLTPLRFRHYVWVSALGGIPATAFNVALGATFLDNPLLFFAISMVFGGIIVGLVLLQQRLSGQNWLYALMYPTAEPPHDDGHAEENAGSTRGDRS